MYAFQRFILELQDPRDLIFDKINCPRHIARVSNQVINFEIEFKFFFGCKVEVKEILLNDVSKVFVVDFDYKLLLILVCLTWFVIDLHFLHGLKTMKVDSHRERPALGTFLRFRCHDLLTNLELRILTH